MRHRYLALAALGLVLASCSPESDVASRNVSRAADQFEVTRRIVFFNGITDKYLLTIEGKCSLGNFDTEKRMSVTCKVGDGLYKKHFLGLSDNVSYFVEQMTEIKAGGYRYRVIFNPSQIIPDIDVR
jgi:hypothetical protein